MMLRTPWASSVLALLCSATSLNSYAAPTAFSECSSPFYLSQGSADSISIQAGTPQSNGSVAFANLQPAPATVDYNAMGYHEPNSFIYALESNRSAYHAANPAIGDSAQLIRIGENGEVERLGALPGLIESQYYAGGMAPSGKYFVGSTGAKDRLDIITLGPVGAELTDAAYSITNLPLDQAIIGPDMAWVGDDATGALYTIYKAPDGNKLYKIDTISGATQLIGGLDNPSSFGALWGSPDALYANANDGSGFVQVSLVTGKETTIGTSGSASSNDGARCVSNRPLFDSNLAISKDNGQTVYTPGQDVSYTIVVTNNGPFGLSDAVVSDPLPTGITNANWSCVTSSGGLCQDPTGTGAINTQVNLPNGATATFTLTLSVPADFTGELKNIATVSVPTLPGGGVRSADDKDLSDNEASDTDRSINAPDNIGTHEVPSLPIYSYVLLLAGLLISARRLRQIKSRNNRLKG